jgi:hypothetical protein
MAPNRRSIAAPSKAGAAHLPEAAAGTQGVPAAVNAGHQPATGNRLLSAKDGSLANHPSAGRVTQGLTVRISERQLMA